MFLVMTALEQQMQQDPWSLLAEYLQHWKLPKSRSESLATLFSPKRKESHKAAKTFKATASEGLSLFPIFTFFLLHIVQPMAILQKEIQAYVELANILEMLQSTALEVTLKSSCRSAWPAIGKIISILNSIGCYICLCICKGGDFSLPALFMRENTGFPRSMEAT